MYGVWLELMGILLFVGGLWMLVATLRPRHTDDIQTIMYFFSLSLVVSTILAIWATQAGVVDRSGYYGSVGRVLQLVVESTKDLYAEVTALVSFLGTLHPPNEMPARNAAQPAAAQKPAGRVAEATR